MMAVGLWVSVPLIQAQSRFSEPEALHEEVTIDLVAPISNLATRLAHDPATGDLYYMTISGEVMRVTIPDSGQVDERQVHDRLDHALSAPQGMTFGPDGVLYLVSNEADEQRNFTRVVIRKGVPQTEGADDRIWRTIAESEPYPLSAAYNHLFNAVVLSPDDQYLYINSGSRTDHGEVQNNRGVHTDDPRELPITAALFKIPANAENLIIPTDEEALAASGLRVARGLRNTYALAFAGNGDLFGVENSGDRDDEEELNWLREGLHYGFPWRMGTNDTPQQFPGYDPQADLMINANYLAGHFSDDPNYPPVPEGRVFTDPIPNFGPDADKFRDPADGQVYDASDEGVSISSFTPHRSPLGLAFDMDSLLADPFRGGGFTLSFTPGSPEDPNGRGPFLDPSQDLLHLDLAKTDQGYTLNATRIVGGFSTPVSGALVGNTMYIIETTLGSTDPPQPGLWAVTLPVFTSGVANTPDVIPTWWLDAEVYPNPTQGIARLAVVLERATTVQVEVVDVLGRTVQQLVPRALQQGRHAFEISLKHIPVGAYFVRVTAENRHLTRKVFKLN